MNRRRKEQRCRHHNGLHLLLLTDTFLLETEKTLISRKDRINNRVKENSYSRLIVQKDISICFKEFSVSLDE